MSEVPLCKFGAEDDHPQVQHRRQARHHGHPGPKEEQIDWCFIVEQPAPAPHLAHPESCAALRIVLVTVPREDDHPQVQHRRQARHHGYSGKMGLVFFAYQSVLGDIRLGVGW